MNILNEFLQKCPQQDGIFAISEPRFFQHPEAAYDAQYGIETGDLEPYRDEGNALIDLCEQFGADLSKPALEIGCGTGRLSLSLALPGRLHEILITDPSPAFCKIAARKFSSVTTPGTDTKLAILMAEDVRKLPQGAFSLIALRSVLHHILDIRRFFFACSDLLAPGGVMLFEEPCYEGYVVMGAMTQFMGDILKSQGVVLSDKHLNDIQQLTETMRFYARRDMDKSGCEDKHLFRVDDLMRICQKCGLRLEMFPNRILADIEHRHEPLPERYFERFYFDYLKYAMAWDPELIGLFERHCKKYFDFFTVLGTGGAMPYTYGTFVCQKTRQQPATR
jgi:2-polyprenyl-3-methyl-5-hydroxy-6-metoxy-1,4-benzoquinol methylase